MADGRSSISCDSFDAQARMTTMNTHDPYDLERFVRAQVGVYETALAEIQAGRKRSHWMWFIFPQFAGLGKSPTSQHYAIRSRAEAKAYLAHPLLGARLCACCEAAVAVAVSGRSARDIFGSPDDVKLRSCATLFAATSPQEPVFQALLDVYFAGEPDQRTLQLLAHDSQALHG
jgi:uncharacterized protein (DUF1810 family)